MITTRNGGERGHTQPTRWRSVPMVVWDVFYICEKRKECTHHIEHKVERRDPTGMMYFCIKEHERLGPNLPASGSRTRFS
jgi:hypothetical protein